MKILITLLLFFSEVAALTENHSTNSQLKKELIGTWHFVELLDKNGKKIDTIRSKFGWEIPKGPTIKFNEDGTYTKQFTATNIDKGRWAYSQENKTIYFKLFIDKNDEIIVHGINKKDKQGNLYQEIKDSVILLTETDLVIFEQPDRSRIFKKVK